MAKQQHQTRPRPRGDIVPINPMRISVGDGPPPASFDPERAPAGEGKPLPGPWRRYPDQKTPPAVKPAKE